MYSFLRLLALSVVLLVCTSATDPVAPGFVYDLDKADLSELVALELQAGNEEVDGAVYDLLPRTDKVESRHFAREMENQAPMIVSYYYKAKDSMLQSIYYLQNFSIDRRADCGECSYGSRKFGRALRRRARELKSHITQTLGPEQKMHGTWLAFAWDMGRNEQYNHYWQVRNTTVLMHNRAFLVDERFKCEEGNACLNVGLIVRRTISKKRQNYLDSAMSNEQVARIKELTDAMHRHSMDSVLSLLPEHYSNAERRKPLEEYRASVLWTQELTQYRFDAGLTALGELVMHRGVQLGPVDGEYTQNLGFTFNSDNEIISFWGYSASLDNY